MLHFTCLLYVATLNQTFTSMKSKTFAHCFMYITATGLLLLALYQLLTINIATYYYTQDELQPTHESRAPPQVSAEPAIVRKYLEQEIGRQLKLDLQRIKLLENRNLEGLSIDNGGTPLRTLLVGQRRSGSSFLGELLSTHPGSYYLFEPELLLDQKQIRNGSLADRANFVLKELFKCRFDALDNDFIKTTIEEGFGFAPRNLLNCTALARTGACMNVEFLCNICRKFPVISIKTVRYRLDSLEELLEDKALSNLKALYLIRDPRATMNSRLKEDWCVNQKDCGNSSLLCSDLAREYHLAQELKRKYADRFMVVRYEDVVQDYFKWTKKIFRFLDYVYTNQTQQYLESHTTETEPGPFSTYRDTKGQLFRWISDLGSNYTVLKNIQDSCTDAMRLWGYEKVLEDDLKPYRLYQTASQKP